MTHTPTPWGIESLSFPPEVNHRNSLRVYATDPGPENDFTIAYVRDPDEPTRKANADLIVRAVNSFDAMRDALNDVMAVFNRPYSLKARIAASEKARAALALADKDEQ